MIGLVKVEHIIVRVLMLENSNTRHFLRHLFRGFLEGMCSYGVLVSTGSAEHIHVAGTP